MSVQDGNPLEAGPLEWGSTVTLGFDRREVADSFKGQGLEGCMAEPSRVYYEVPRSLLPLSLFF